jgi:hypothetical protein
MPLADQHAPLYPVWAIRRHAKPGGSNQRGSDCGPGVSTAPDPREPARTAPRTCTTGLRASAAVGLDGRPEFDSSTAGALSCL